MVEKVEIEISLIVPVYNCASWITEKIQVIYKHFKQKEFSWEIIIVDDSSVDDTPVTIEKVIEGIENIKLLVLEKNMGKGGAVLTGLRQARGKNRVFTDCDLSYPLSEVDKIVVAMQNGADVAIANRRNEESICELKPHIFKQVYSRELFGRILNRIIRLLSLTDFYDTQAGLKGVQSWLIPHLDSMHVYGFGFDIELLLIAGYRGAKIESIPVRYQFFDEVSTVNVFVDGFSMLKDILKLKHKQSIGYYS